MDERFDQSARGQSAGSGRSSDVYRPVWGDAASARPVSAESTPQQVSRFSGPASLLWLLATSDSVGHGSTSGASVHVPGRIRPLESRLRRGDRCIVRAETATQRLGTRLAAGCQTRGTKRGQHLPAQRGPGGAIQGQGSGVIVDVAGYIVTNHHVITGADSIQVELSDGRRAAAEVVGDDALTDLAILKIDLPNLIAAEWGNSDDLQVGDLVWASVVHSGWNAASRLES